jgi:predicted HicB family RNase H-like nuclease
MSDMIRIPIDPEVHEQLRIIARRRGKSMSAWLRDIIQREVGDSVNVNQGIKSHGGRRNRA